MTGCWWGWAHLFIHNPAHGHLEDMCVDAPKYPTFALFSSGTEQLTNGTAVYLGTILTLPRLCGPHLLTPPLGPHPLILNNDIGLSVFKVYCISVILTNTKVLKTKTTWNPYLQPHWISHSGQSHSLKELKWSLMIGEEAEGGQVIDKRGGECQTYPLVRLFPPLLLPFSPIICLFADAKKLQIGAQHKLS